jgi:nucleotidyltransferase substrate binding protein (TIGR01987 family)
MTKDIRYIQRFENFCKAFGQLDEAVKLATERKLSRLEEQGLVQAFEYTHELAWNVLKDFMTREGVMNLFGSKTVTREAFRLGLIKDGEVWMGMIKDRNETVHAYDEKKADKIVKDIIEKYLKEFLDFRETFSKLKKEDEIRS